MSALLGVAYCACACAFSMAVLWPMNRSDPTQRQIVLASLSHIWPVVVIVLAVASVWRRVFAADPIPRATVRPTKATCAKRGYTP